MLRSPRAVSRVPRVPRFQPRAEAPRAGVPRAESPFRREPRAGARERARVPPRAESRSITSEIRVAELAESREPRVTTSSSCPSPGRTVPRLNSRCRRRPPESSPAAPSRRGFPCCRFAFRRLAALAGGFRRSLPAAVLLALAALVPVLPSSSAVAQEMAEVGGDWPLKPSGIARGGQFRLIFLSTEWTSRRHLVEHRRLQQLRAGTGYGMATQPHPALRGAVPGCRQHERGGCPGQHRHHGHGRADLLAERKQGRRQLCRLLRRQLGRRDQSKGSKRSAQRPCSQEVVRMERQALGLSEAEP